jgi:AraC-like DNA-binding protein
VLAAAATGFRDFVGRHGGDADQVFCSVGVEEKELQNLTLALDLGAYVAMMELAAHQTGNENFGLWYGQQFQPEMLGLIGGIAIASPNLRSALTNLAALFPYHQQATDVRFSTDGELMRLHYRIIDGGIVERRQDAELTLGMFINVFRHCLGAQWRPEEIHCEHPKPDGWREHEQAFAAPVYFGQRTNAIIFRGGDLEHRMPNGNLLRLAELRDRLIQVGAGTGVVSLLDQVKGEIRSRLPDGPITIEVIAAALVIPRWTLQRRLADYGLSFSDLVDLVRRDLAACYIGRSSVTVAEIADILGFSELSALSRAFRRWFGVSPQKFRRKSAARETYR